MSCCHISQRLLKGFHGPLRLIVGLRIIPRETRFRPESCAEGSPKLGYKLQPSFRHARDGVNADNVLNDEIPHLRS